MPPKRVRALPASYGHRSGAGDGCLAGLTSQQSQESRMGERKQRAWPEWQLDSNSQKDRQKDGRRKAVEGAGCRDPWAGANRPSTWSSHKGLGLL